MGTFLTSVQVRLGDKPRTETRALIIAAVRQRVLEGPYIETTTEEDHDPDRTVLVGPLGKAPWLTVIDKQENLRELAPRLSAVVQGAAVFINLLDSDVVHLRLYEDGAVFDDYCNAPESYDSYTYDPDWLPVWGTLSRSQLKARTRGRAEKWRDLLTDGTEPKKLRAIWNSKPVFADDILWGTADALGMDSNEISSMGEAEGFTRLTFRLSKPREYEIKATGLPKLSLAGYGVPERVYVGDIFDVSIMVQNDGAEGTGLDVTAWGSALEKGILKLTSANVQLPTRLEDALLVGFEPVQGKIGDQAANGYLARFDALKLPQGIADGRMAQMQRGVDWQKAYMALALTQIHTRILGSIQTTGDGDIFVGFIPYNNRDGGQTVYRASLRALPAPRRPLRSREAPKSDLFQKLANPVQLFALVAMDSDRVRTAALVADVLQAWAVEMTHQSGKSLVTHLRSRPDLMPDKKRLDHRAVADSAYWRALREALETCVSFSAEGRAARAVFDVDTIFFQKSREEPAPQLGFFNVPEKVGDAANKSAEHGMIDIVDQLMKTGAIVQAMIGRWDWGPYPGLNMTPYEVACGVGGQCTTARFWCRRFLRGVTEKVWLGPDLVAQLGGTDQLVPIAHVTPVGNGVRIFLDASATIDQLEVALAPLLPGEKDWREGIDRLYMRR
ncbi:MAG: hypothetical protein M1482_15455 [Chloroflexi bacterium]|nr:hypothetical protein [Chloroflexota bacterium]